LSDICLTEIRRISYKIFYRVIRNSDVLVVVANWPVIKKIWGPLRNVSPPLVSQNGYRPSRNSDAASKSLDRAQWTTLYIAVFLLYSKYIFPDDQFSSLTFS